MELILLYQFKLNHITMAFYYLFNSILRFQADRKVFYLL